ncbi:hypothetical protein ACOSQ3_007238 [Xanthoceras sorbifolium]
METQTSIFNSSNNHKTSSILLGFQTKHLSSFKLPQNALLFTRHSVEQYKYISYMSYTLCSFNEIRYWPFRSHELDDDREFEQSCVEVAFQKGSPASSVRSSSVPPLFTVGCDRVCSGLLLCGVSLFSGGVLARSKPPSIGCCSLAGWWSGDRLWIPLKRAGSVLALSGFGGFVVTGAVGDPDRGFCVLRVAACCLGSCVQLRVAVSRGCV